MRATRKKAKVTRKCPALLWLAVLALSGLAPGGVPRSTVAVEQKGAGRLQLPRAEHVHFPSPGQSRLVGETSPVGLHHLWVTRGSLILDDGGEVLWDPRRPDSTAKLRSKLEAMAESLPRKGIGAQSELVIHADEEAPFAVVGFLVRMCMDTPSIRIWKFQIAVRSEQSDAPAWLGFYGEGRLVEVPPCGETRSLGFVRDPGEVRYYVLDGDPVESIDVVIREWRAIDKSGRCVRFRPEACVPWGVVVQVIDALMPPKTTLGAVDPQPRFFWRDGAFEL